VSTETGAPADVKQELVERAEAWHAADCPVDAGGGCTLHIEEKEAWAAGYLDGRAERDAEVERLRAVVDAASWGLLKIAVARLGTLHGGCGLLAAPEPCLYAIAQVEGQPTVHDPRCEQAAQQEGDHA
jgi:hypothetical protein